MRRSKRPTDRREINIDWTAAAEHTHSDLLAEIIKGYSVYDTGSPLHLRRSSCDVFTEPRTIDFTAFSRLFRQVRPVEMKNVRLSRALCGFYIHPSGYSEISCCHFLMNLSSISVTYINLALSTCARNPVKECDLDVIVTVKWGEGTHFYHLSWLESVGYFWAERRFFWSHWAKTKPSQQRSSPSWPQTT